MADHETGPLIFNAELRDDFAKSFVAAQIAYKGMAFIINGEQGPVQRRRLILWAYKMADEMMLAREGKLKL